MGSTIDKKAVIRDLDRLEFNKEQWQQAKKKLENVFFPKSIREIAKRYNTSRTTILRIKQEYEKKK